MTHKKISQVLQTTDRKQCRGSLVHTKFDPKSGEETIDSYCALGALGCEAGLISLSNQGADYNNILKSYGVYKYLLNIDFTSELEFRVPFRDDDGNCSNPITPVRSLSSLIYRLNDTTKLSFKEIGEFLEVSLGL